jgi:hypothetical protein
VYVYVRVLVRVCGKKERVSIRLDSIGLVEEGLRRVEKELSRMSCGGAFFQPLVRCLDGVCGCLYLRLCLPSTKYVCVSNHKRLQLVNNG